MAPNELSWRGVRLGQDATIRGLGPGFSGERIVEQADSSVIVPAIAIDRLFDNFTFHLFTNGRLPDFDLRYLARCGLLSGLRNLGDNLVLSGLIGQYAVYADAAAVEERSDYGRQSDASGNQLKAGE